MQFALVGSRKENIFRVTYFIYTIFELLQNIAIALYVTSNDFLTCLSYQKRKAGAYIQTPNRTISFLIHVITKKVLYAMMCLLVSLFFLAKAFRGHWTEIDSLQHKIAKYAGICDFYAISTRQNLFFWLLYLEMKLGLILCSMFYTMDVQDVPLRKFNTFSCVLT